MILEEEDRQIGDATAHMAHGEEALAWVAENADRVEAAKFDLAVSVVKAHEQGLSLRAIAEKAKMSHEQVRRIVSEQDQKYGPSTAFVKMLLGEG